LEPCVKVGILMKNARSAYDGRAMSDLVFTGGPFQPGVKNDAKRVTKSLLKNNSANL